MTMSTRSMPEKFPVALLAGVSHDFEMFLSILRSRGVKTDWEVPFTQKLANCFAPDLENQVATKREIESLFKNSFAGLEVFLVSTHEGLQVSKRILVQDVEELIPVLRESQQPEVTVIQRGSNQARVKMFRGLLSDYVKEVRFLVIIPPLSATQLAA